MKYKAIILSGILILIITCLNTKNVFSQEVDLAKPAANGVFIYLLSDLANGSIIDYYLVERADGKLWVKLAEIKAPASWEDFDKGVSNYKTDFAFHNLPDKRYLQELWKKSIRTGTVDSLYMWSTSPIIRLASGTAYYDKQAPKDIEHKYRVSVFSKKSNKPAIYLSKSVKWPQYNSFDPVVLDEQNTSTNLFYLKWKSLGSNPAPFFKVMYYEGQELKTGNGVSANYKVDNANYYVFQDSIKKEFSDKQYFMVPLDIYGNMGKPTEITLVSKQNAKNTFFTKTIAVANKDRLGIKLTWIISNSAPIKGINVYRSETFDKDFLQIGSVKSTDTSFLDNNVKPDKILYYYLEAENKYNNQKVTSGKFFNYSHDPLKPVVPFISKSRDIKNGVELNIQANEVNIAGIRVYRSTGSQKDLVPISDLLPLKNAELVFADTSSEVMPNQGYAYAAKIENNSHQLSDFSNMVYLSSGKSTPPSTPGFFNVFEEDNAVKLNWTDMAEDNLAIRGYVLYKREKGKPRFELVSPKDSICKLNYSSDTLVKSATTYEYALQSVDFHGNVSKSLAIAFITTHSSKPMPPSGIKGFASEGKVYLQWGEILNADELQVKIYRYQRGNKPEAIKTLSVKDVQYTDTTIKKGELYFYYLTIINKGNIESAPSAELSIRVD